MVSRLVARVPEPLQGPGLGRDALLAVAIIAFLLAPFLVIEYLPLLPVVQGMRELMWIYFPLFVADMLFFLRRFRRWTEGD